MRIISILIILLMTAPTLSNNLNQIGENQYKIVPNDSWIRVLAYPDGPLRRFGHHHVISHTAIKGTVKVKSDLSKSSIDLELKVSDFVVDDATLRMLEDENFQKEVSQKDINGTRENMLGEKLLNVEQFPLIRVSTEKIDGEIPDFKIETAITIKDATYKVVIPANISISDNSLIASGKFELNQTEIGLVPFSAAGGALTVRDLLVFKYEIYAALE